MTPFMQKLATMTVAIQDAFNKSGADHDSTQAAVAEFLDACENSTGTHFELKLGHAMDKRGAAESLELARRDLAKGEVIGAAKKVLAVFDGPEPVKVEEPKPAPAGASAGGDGGGEKSSGGGSDNAPDLDAMSKAELIKLAKDRNLNVDIKAKVDDLRGEIARALAAPAGASAGGDGGGEE